MMLSTFNKIEMWFWRIWKIVAFILSIIFLFFLISQIGHYKYQILKTTTITETLNPDYCKIDNSQIGQKIMVDGNERTITDINTSEYLGEINIYLRDYEETLTPKDKEEIRLINLKNCEELPKPHPYLECVKDVNDNSGMY